MPQTKILMIRTNVVKVVGKDPVDFHVFLPDSSLFRARPGGDYVEARV